MATYSNLGIKLITTGDESGTWGTSTNSNFSDVLDEAIAGAVTYNIASDADFTLTVSDGTSSDARHAVIKFTSTTLSATRTCTFAPDDLQKVWIVINATTGGQSLTFKQGSAGATVTVPNGESAIIYSDGAGATNGAIARVLDSFTNTKITTGTLNATNLDLTNLEVTNIKAKDGTAAITIADSTGKVTVSTELAVDNLNLSGNAITSTNSNGNIDLTPNGTGEVNITKVDIDSGAIDGTAIGANSASTGAFTTLSASGNITVSGGTANGLLYLDGSKIVSSGSVLTYNGTTLVIDSAAVFNESGGNVDYRFEGDTDQNLLFLDASADTVFVGTTTNTNSSKLVVNGTISETVSSNQYLIASQYDVGTAPNQIPLNQYLGTMAFQDAAGVSVDQLSISGSIALSGLTASTALALDASKNVVSVTNTGTGNNVLATSPTLTTPNLGTPSAVTLTNATGLPVSTGISGLGANVATFLATPSSSNLAAAVTDETGSGALVFATSPTLTTPNLGTPSALTLTNATGLPVSTGISGLGANVATFLATPSSSNLAAAVTDETGSGALVFATSPTLTTPNLGTPSAVTLTNGTGLPISSGVSGLGSNVATALAVNVGTAGAFVVNGGALGTPSSGTVTNLTGTASININGTVGATTPNTGAFTTLSATGNVTLGDATSDTITANGRFNTDIVPSTDNARDLGTSALQFRDVYSVEYWENGYNIASQADVGTAPNQLPLNQYLGTMAFQDSAGITVGQLRANGTGGIGYSTGAGSAVTQATSRTTGVTINAACGAITLVSAAGTTSWQTFTVTNSAVAATDTIVVNQKSGTDLNMIHVTNVAAGSFKISFATTGGTTTEQPVFNFAVIKAVAA